MQTEEKSIKASASFEKCSPLGGKSKEGDAESVSLYALTPNGTAVSGINKAIAGKRIKDGKVFRVLTDEFYIRSPYDGFDVYFNATSRGKLTTATKQFLVCVWVKIAENRMRSPEAVITLSEFQKMKGNISRNGAYLQISDSINSLVGMTITFTEKTQKHLKEKDFSNISVFDLLEYKKGKIRVVFGNTFFNLIKNYSYRILPMEVLAINGNIHQYAFTLSELIEEHRKNSPQGKGDVLYVEKLLNDAGFPKADSVYGSYKKKIIIPFEKNMDALTYLSWEYIDRDGNPIERKGDTIPWEVFSKARIRTTYKEEPQYKTYSKRERVEQEEFVLDGNATEEESSVQGS